MRGRSRRALLQAAALGTAAWAAPILGGLASPRSARAADGVPEGPIRIVVPFGPGGVADLTVRAVAQPMAADLGVPVVIENKPGAGGIVAGQQVSTARPDGRTLLLVSNGSAVSASLFRSLPFDPLASFTAVGTLGGFAIAIVVPAASPWQSLADLLAAARQRPGQLNLGSVAIGSTQHLSAELFKTRAGIDAQVVPFNGTPALITAVRAGHVDAGFESVGPLLSQFGAGGLRALAVSSAARSPALPAVPTVAEAGVADYDVVSWNGLSAPVGTPAALVRRLNTAIQRALADKEVADRLRALGVEPLPGTAAALEARLADEIIRWRQVIERAGIARQ